MNERTTAIVKFVGASIIGTTLAAMAFPAVKSFFKLNKKAEPEVIPSEDIEDEEICDNE
jgi:hypothetical protein